MPLTSVMTREGRVIGIDRGDYAEYRGIPYALPPVGERRFCAPQPPEKRETPFYATEFSAVCPQAFMEEGSFYDREFYFDHDALPVRDEDCLTLNICTPARCGDEKLPVAMWIHGGAFDHGWAFETEFDGAAFARSGVVLVTINYRVGAFGFFAHPDLGRGSGNFGIHDQIAALQWVRDNIASFGGDPENITIFGQSAGAMSVQTLISSPLTRGMIAKAILQSGGGLDIPLDRSRTIAQAEEIGAELMRFCGCETIEEMRALPSETLLDAQMRCIKAHPEYGMGFMPSIDGDLLVESVNAAARGNRIHDIPYMIGSTKNDIAVTPERLARGERGPFFTGCVNFAKSRPNGAYVYDFVHDLPGDDAGAFHSSELWYVFGTYPRSTRPMAEEDAALSAEMVRAWTDFIRTGSPGWPVYIDGNPYIKTFE